MSTKRFRRTIIATVATLLFSTAAVVSTLAYTVGSGYMKDPSGAETNIKYTVDEDGVVTFEIDPNATDKVQSTTIYAIDPADGSKGGWDTALPTFSLSKKMIIGDGITALNSVMIANGHLETVEIPMSLTSLSGTAFESCSRLATIYIRGNEPIDGMIDLSNITSLGVYCFDGCRAIESIKFGANYVGNIPTEFLKNNSKIKEIELPEGVTTVKSNSLVKLSALETLIVNGMDTLLESENVFGSASTFPAIKAHAGSSAERFAIENGFTFIDIDTGETTEGTRLAPSAEEESSGGTSGGTSSGFTPKEGTTDWGHSTQTYGEMTIVNTYWAYFEDTQTLEFTTGGGGYNETGKESDCDNPEKGWGNYKDVVEHIIVNGGIHKMSNNAFSNMPKLRDVVFTESSIQCDVGCFTNCTSLVSVRRIGTDEEFGVADATEFAKLNNSFENTGIREIILPKGTKTLDCAVPINIETLYAYEYSEELRAFCEENRVNLFAVDGSNFEYEYFIKIPDGVTFCGDRAAYLLDEATGIMTIYGSGKIDDISNYYGGGSKFSPFVKVKKNVKHLVITDGITSLGKYSFCEFTNLETVELPNADIELGIAAFEKCTNLRSVYRAGSEPIEGTADLGRITSIGNYTFAYDYLIANVILNEGLEKLSPSTFDDNMNLAGVYGVVGSVAETFAAENGLTFYDSLSNTPSPIKCELPETTIEETEPEPEPDTEPITDSETGKPTEATPETGEETEDSSGSSVPVIIIIAVAAFIAAGAAVLVVLRRRRAK